MFSSSRTLTQMLTLRRLRGPAALGDAGGVGEGGTILQVALVARVARAALVAQAATARAARAAGRRPGRSGAARAARMLAVQCCWWRRRRGWRGWSRRPRAGSAAHADGYARHLADRLVWRARPAVCRNHWEAQPGGGSGISDPRDPEASALPPRRVPWRGCRAGGVDGMGWPWRGVALAARAAQT